VEAIDVNCHVDGFGRELKLLRFVESSSFDMILASLTHLSNDLPIFNRQTASSFKQGCGRAAGANCYLLPTSRTLLHGIFTVPHIHGGCFVLWRVPMNRVRLTAFALAFSLFSANAIAADPPTANRQKAQAKFKKVDANGDGKISRSEWKAAGYAEVLFVRIDKNGNGVIESAEFIVGQAI
jgi:hypothetical protein